MIQTPAPKNEQPVILRPPAVGLSMTQSLDSVDIGSPGGIRTPDQVINSHLLYR